GRSRSTGSPGCTSRSAAWSRRNTYSRATITTTRITSDPASCVCPRRSEASPGQGAGGCRAERSRPARGRISAACSLDLPEVVDPDRQPLAAAPRLVPDRADHLDADARVQGPELALEGVERAVRPVELGAARPRHRADRARDAHGPVGGGD